MYRILIVSEDFVLRKAVAFSLNDLDACVECADTDRKSTRLNSSHIL